MRTSLFIYVIVLYLSKKDPFLTCKNAIFVNTLLSYFPYNTNKFRVFPVLEDLDIRIVKSGISCGGAVLSLNVTTDFTCICFEDKSLLQRRKAVSADPAFRPANIGRFSVVLVQGEEWALVCLRTTAL